MRALPDHRNATLLFAIDEPGHIRWAAWRLGRNPEIVSMFSCSQQSDKPARLLAAPGLGFGSIIWISIFRNHRRVRASRPVKSVALDLRRDLRLM
jgi:hypothetical protein